ncbi:MAG: mechanosensitive ion channel domain-containing protein [Cyanobacteria bacterium J06592_8]
MREASDLDFTLIFELFWKVLHALERSVVQMQLLGIAIGLILAWLISQGIWIQWQRQFSTTNGLELSDKKPNLKHYITDGLRYLLNPVLGLIVVSFLKASFLQWGWRAGLITVALNIQWTFFFYRFFLLICYQVFPSATVSRYRSQFFIPLLILFIINTILSLLTGIEQLSQVAVMRLFDSPVTLGAIFVITVGIYFWVIGVSIIEKLFLSVFFLRANTKAGITQATSIRATSIIIRYLLIGIGIVLFFGYVGFNPTTLAAISGGLSVGIGFSLKEILGNFMSGIGLLFEGSLRPGDMVEVEGEAATVEQVGVRATTVKTFDNIEKIVPNQYFFTSIVTTYTGRDSVVRVLVPVGVSYNSDPEKVIEILLDVAGKNEQVQLDPKPYVHLMGYGDSSVDFRLAVFINDPAIRLTVKSNLYRSIWKALAAHHIEIPFPQRDLHIRSDSTK